MVSGGAQGKDTWQDPKVNVRVESKALRLRRLSWWSKSVFPEDKELGIVLQGAVKPVWQLGLDHLTPGKKSGTRIQLSRRNHAQEKAPNLGIAQSAVPGAANRWTPMAQHTICKELVEKIEKKKLLLEDPLPGAMGIKFTSYT